MKRNLGTADRILRTLVGFALIAAGIIYHSWLGAIGTVPLLTALIGYLPRLLPDASQDCRPLRRRQMNSVKKSTHNLFANHELMARSLTE